jgi:hypothetical protein
MHFGLFGALGFRHEHCLPRAQLALQSGKRWLSILLIHANGFKFLFRARLAALFNASCA